MNGAVGWGGFGFIAALLTAASVACSAQETYLQIVCSQYALSDKAVPSAVRRSLQRPLATAFTDARGNTWQASSQGLTETGAHSGQKKILSGKDGLPVTALKGIAAGGDGRLWLATGQGLVLFVPDAVADQRWFYFAGERYLADNDVLQMVAEKNQAWVLTRSGISLVRFAPYSLEQKSQVFVDRIQARHNRYGMVAGAELVRAGDPASFRMLPDDNDGLWSSIYVTAECFRYAATGSAEALKNARTSLRAMLRLVSITAIPGFPARSLMRRGDYRSPDGEWHWTADGHYEWKGDTSSDELVGHFFAYWVAYQLLPDDGDRAAIRAAVSSIAGGLIDHHWQLLGYGGRVTTWGRYDPRYLHSEGSGDRALDSLELLSHLSVAYRITGEARFLAAYRRVAGELGYVDNVLQFIPGKTDEINYSDEELAFLSFYPLMESESDPRLLAQYRVALTGLWQRVRAEKNPLWNLMYAHGTGAAAFDCTDAVQALQSIPLSTVLFTVRNSQRADLVHQPAMDRFGEAQAETALAPSERRVMKWNSNPFQLDSSEGGRGEDDGAFFLLPYWLGRHENLLSCHANKPWSRRVLAGRDDKSVGDLHPLR